MSNIEDVRELSITELFTDGQYVIPIYQRNYAWGPAEVEQLLQDILDSALRLESQKNYYLGSLVVSLRDDESFEIIDGQQRHTTLGILLAVLKTVFEKKMPSIEEINLKFDSRHTSATTLQKLFAGLPRDHEALDEQAMYMAFEVSSRFLHRERKVIEQFSNYLLEKVRIFRVVVPTDTDLNHYFEVMNNRGEQLEKHEVLKARMMGQLTTNVEQHAFATIWNACSEMGRYVQLGFPDDSRTKLFGTDWNSKPKNFDEIAQILAVGSVNSSAISLEKILNPATLFGNENDSDDKVEEFRSVINFPNFLLHVLRADKSDIPLDDKQLLKIFESIHIDPRTFAINLLECRMLFDRYIIHRKNEGEWGLMRLVGYAGKKGNVSYDDSFNSVQNPQIVMLLSMFHASFPTMTYKHWLSAALRFLITSTREQGSVNGADYIRWMETVSDRFLYGRFGENDVVDYFDLCLENQVQLPERINIAELNLGTNVQNFIFNRLDYLLWKRLSANEYFTGVQMDYIRSRWRKFSFTSRTSVEHYYPQQPLSGAPKLEKSSTFPTGCDTFGNLCLISPRSNSRLSNHLPEAKKEYIEKSGIVESLKQTFMISYPAWGPGAEASMLAHEQMMIDVLCARSSN